MKPQTIASNILRAYGYQVGSTSYRVLHYLRTNPTLSFNMTELAEKLNVKRISIEAAMFNGINAGCFTKEKVGRGMEYKFLAMPAAKPSRLVPRNASINRPCIGKQADLLEKRSRTNFAAQPKQRGDNTPVPHSSARKVTVAENYPPHRYWTPSAEVPSYFSSMPLGSTLGAA